LLEEPFELKIGDLGFAKVLKSQEDLSHTYCGTPLNMAPEMLNGSVYNYKADVWSLGTIMFEMLTGYSPFRHAQNKEDLKRRINQEQIQLPNTIFLSK